MAMAAPTFGGTSPGVAPPFSVAFTGRSWWTTVVHFQIVRHGNLPASPGIPTTCLQVLNSLCCQCRNKCQDRKLQWNHLMPGRESTQSVASLESPTRVYTPRRVSSSRELWESTASPKNVSFSLPNLSFWRCVSGGPTQMFDPCQIETLAMQPHRELGNSSARQPTAVKCVEAVPWLGEGLQGGRLGR